MTFAFTVEDGSIVPSANSYVTVQEADDYIIQNIHAYPAWESLDLVQKQYLLAWATRYLDRRARWNGTPTSSRLGGEFSGQYSSPSVAGWLYPPVEPSQQMPSASALQVNTGSPTILQITTSPANGILVTGNTVTLTVEFSNIVNVAGGVPTLLLNDGGTAIYQSGSGSQNLVFTYTVQAGQATTFLAPASAAAIQLNGCTIADNANNNAVLVNSTLFNASTTPTLQSLRWPRCGVYDQDNRLIPYNVIPSQLKEATCEMARYLIAQDRSLERPQDGLKELKIDVMTLVFNLDYTLPIVPGMIGYILTNLGTIGSGRTNFAKITRA
jgi:hypothetical protein